MKIAGIVAEFNPFHKGHAHLMERLRDPVGGPGVTHIVTVMSGHFVQRGEPAILPKSCRTAMALAGGADLVLELPAPWALSSAEGFAFGAVSLLDALGCVDVLGFGSECGEAARLEEAVDTLALPRFSQLLRYHMEGGYPFPEARQKAVAELRGERVAGLFAQANNTLGIEYIKALRQRQSAMQPVTIPRLGAAHDAPLPSGDMASAGFLRTLIGAERPHSAVAYMPRAAGEILTQAAQDGECPARVERLERALLARLRTMEPEELAALPGLSEGLENRLYKAARQADSYAQLLEMIKTRRYPLTRIQRLVWAAFLGIRAADVEAEPGADTIHWKMPPYLRVLGANERGLDILRAAKAPALPVLSRSQHEERLDDTGRRIFSIECRAADLYALALPRPFPCGREYTTGVIRPAEGS